MVPVKTCENKKREARSRKKDCDVPPDECDWDPPRSEAGVRNSRKWGHGRSCCQRGKRTGEEEWWVSRRVGMVRNMCW